MKKLIGNKIVLGAAAAAILVTVFAFVLLRPMIFGGGESVAGQGQHVRAEGDRATSPVGTQPPPGHTYRLKDRILNLNGTPRQYLKLGIALEFRPEKDAYYKLDGHGRKKADEEFTAELTPRVPAIEDIVTTVVSAKTLEQVSTPSGQANLKEELMTRVRSVIHDPELVRIYFTEFVTQ